MKVRIFGLLILSVIVCIACGTVPATNAGATGDNAFLVQNLDDTNKAVALTNQGVVAYNTYLVQQADYTKVDYVRQYFLVALRYDPDNVKARQYMDKVDDFKGSLVDSRLKVAAALSSKPNRKESDDYALMVAIQTAVAVDPNNETAGKLLKANAPLQSSLSDTYLKRSLDSKRKAEDKKTPEAEREALFLSSYDDASKALAVSPANAKAKSQQASLSGALSKAFDAHAAAESKSIQAGKFDDARAELGKLVTLNSKLGGKRAADVQAATYTLYFQWAKALDAKGQASDASDKLDQAIAARRSAEALELRKKISAKATSTNQEAAFDAALPEIDKSIAKGDYAAATRRIDSASRLTKDKAKLDQLDSRRAKMRDSIAGLYEAGVAAYRSEDFKTAIDKLSSVVGFNADYEQAGDYLAKAKEKQKLLDQFGQ